MTFQTQILEDMADIINGDFSLECIHTPKGGVAQPAFNCLKDEAVLNGDSETLEVTDEDINISVITSEVTAVKQWDFITIDSVKYEVVGNPYISLSLLGSSVIELRRRKGTPAETKI